MDTIIKTGASIHLRTDDGDNSEKAERWYQHVRDNAEIHPWSSEDHQLKAKGSETEQSRATDPVRQELSYLLPSVTSEVSWSPISYWLLLLSSQTKTAVKFGAVLQVKPQLVDSPEALSHTDPGSLGCNSIKLKWHPPMPYL